MLLSWQKIFAIEGGRMPRQPTQELQTAEDISVNIVPVGSVKNNTPPTLENVFYMLCQALVEACKDNLGMSLHAEEIQGWYMDGNHTVAWAHAVMLLEQTLGQRLTA